ncbi:MAG: hypothetical protein F6K09_07630 [Merismopedia sp. SIO2A8]|nr:hypothetical protein [Merismopedia sp. SIO2A8]
MIILDVRTNDVNAFLWQTTLDPCVNRKSGERNHTGLPLSTTPFWSYGDRPSIGNSVGQNYGVSESEREQS